MMQSFTLLLVVALAGAAYAVPKELYDDRYDNVNLDEIIANKRLLHPYIKCCLDLGKCSPDGKLLKSHIRDALETNCEMCTPAQKTGTRKMLKHLINEEPEYWTQLCDKFDKTRKFAAMYEKQLREFKRH